MNWSNLFLLCFVVGFVLSLFSFFGGSVHLPHVHVHLQGRGGATVFPAAMSFLTWFGGTGYLLEHYEGLSATLALLCAVAIGALGSWLVVWLLQRVLQDEQPLSPEDYDMIGVLGRVASPIREGGTGEMIFSLQGTRRGVPVRSEDHASLPRGTEVVVMRFEKGIAYVKLWDELSR